MARYLHIRCVVIADRTSAQERVDAVGGISADGSHWTLAQDKAISQIEDGTSVFYLEKSRGQRLDVTVGLHRDGGKYLKTVADRDRPYGLLSLPICP